MLYFSIFLSLLSRVNSLQLWDDLILLNRHFYKLDDMFEDKEEKVDDEWFSPALCIPSFVGLPAIPLMVSEKSK